MCVRVECPKCGCCNHVLPGQTPGPQHCCRECGYRIVQSPDGAEDGEERQAPSPNGSAQQGGEEKSCPDRPASAL
jgi:hypothetical protein